MSVASGAEFRKISFEIGGKRFEGELLLPEKRHGSLPAILIVPDWMGPRAYFTEMAQKITERGYAAFVADVYGVDVRPANSEEASGIANKLRSGDRKVLRNRIRRNLAVLGEQPEVDADKIVAIGFCFGGTTVLELARTGADLKGVVSFHGHVDSPAPADKQGAIVASVLVLHGDSDPYVPEGDIQAFEDEMRKARVDWELVKFGGAVHSFTDPAADSAGARYAASAARRSWVICWDFCRELLGR